MADIINAITNMMKMLCTEFGAIGISMGIIILMLVFFMYVIYRFLNYNEKQMKTVNSELKTLSDNQIKTSGKMNEIVAILNFFYSEKERRK